MENLIVYIAKACGLTAMFYMAYYLLLRKETFFRANRWFLLAGMVTATVLPIVVFTKVIWVTPQPMPSFNIQELGNMAVIQTAPATPEPFIINWWYVAAGAYSIGTAFLLARLVFDFRKVLSLFKGQNIIRQGKYKFIDSKAAKSPFSFFSYIIFNSAALDPGELVGILSHEKVHSRQKHSVDIIAAQVFCAAFWFNPFAWLYKNAIAQNLEFIADAEAIKYVEDATAYQKTLLKITLQPAVISITNPFYQSLIKKRIVMLNKPKSKKHNSWKYAVVVPALAAFMAFFQVEVIAQEKHENATATQVAADSSETVIITKYIKDDALAQHAEQLSKTYGITVTFKNVTRNDEGDITGILAEVYGEMGQNVTQKKYEIKGKEPIGTFMLTIKKTGNEVEASFSQPAMAEGKIVLDKYDEATVPAPAPEGYDKLLIIIDGIIQPKGVGIENIKATDIVSINIFKNATDKYGPEGKYGVMEVTTKKANNATTTIRTAGVTFAANPVYVINGVRQSDNNAMANIDSGSIKSVTVLKNDDAVKKYGEGTENGVIEVITTTSGGEFDINKSPSQIFKDKNNHQQSYITTVTTQKIISDGTNDGQTSWSAEGAVQITGTKDGKKMDFRLADDGESGFLVLAKSTDKDLDYYAEILLKNNLKFKYSGIKRNSNGDIVKIKIELSEKGTNNNAVATFENNQGIPSIYVGKKGGYLIVTAQK